MSNLTILGNKKDGSITKDELEFFPCPDGVIDAVTFETHEFTSLCPVTNQPDLYTVKITYMPDERCVESKSLKLYLMQWRNEGIFGEAITAQICNELFEFLDPWRCEVTTIQQVRGGLQMTSHAIREAEIAE
jgi:7-cyano-7-deazaguanine reductase